VIHSPSIEASLFGTIGMAQYYLRAREAEVRAITIGGITRYPGNGGQGHAVMATDASLLLLFFD
jgi:hypothetical protein